MLTLVQASQASGKITTTKDLQILRTLCSDAVAEATVVSGPAKRLAPQGCHLSPSLGERKSGSNTLHATISLWFCIFCCCCWYCWERQASCWPNSRGLRGLSQVVTSMLPFPWFSTSLFLIPEYGSSASALRCSCCCLIWHYTTLPLLVHHYLIFYLYSPKLNATLLFLWIECTCLGAQQRHGNFWTLWQGTFRWGQGTSDNSALPSRRGVYMCMDHKPPESWTMLRTWRKSANPEYIW